MSGKAVVLLSGGIDSATTLAIAKAEGLRVYALSFNYGQRHAAELAAAARVAMSLGVQHHLTVALPMAVFGRSALTDPDIPVPAYPAAGIDATYVPARNTVFLSLALAWAESTGSSSIFIGATAQDQAGYPDCRPEYLAAFDDMAACGTSAGVNRPRVRAPLISMTKAQVIMCGLDLGVDYALTRSCYQPGPDPCGACGACTLRAEAFAEMGVPDPAMP